MNVHRFATTPDSGRQGAQRMLYLVIENFRPGRAAEVYRADGGRAPSGQEVLGLT